MKSERMITRGKSYSRYSNWHNDVVTYTPLYCNGHHVINLTSNYTTQNRREAAELLLQMRKNKCKYICYYCYLQSAEKDMFKFAAEVKRLGWHYNEFAEIVIWQQSDGEIELMEFHGNIQEYSCSFSFRIFDKTLVSRIAKATGLKVTNKVFNDETKKYEKQ